MEQVLSNTVSKRLAYRLANHLPKPIRIAYYIILWATAIYVLYRFTRWLLESIQKVGAFMFEKRNYWTSVWVVFIMAVGSILIAQFWYGLDPVGHVIRWIENLAKGWVVV